MVRGGSIYVAGWRRDSPSRDSSLTHCVPVAWWQRAAQPGRLFTGRRVRSVVDDIARSPSPRSRSTLDPVPCMRARSAPPRTRPTESDQAECPRSGRAPRVMVTSRRVPPVARAGSPPGTESPRCRAPIWTSERPQRPKQLPRRPVSQSSSGPTSRLRP
jgi:hypothetical protein